MFSDRIEILSRGTIPPGQTMEGFLRVNLDTRGHRGRRCRRTVPERPLASSGGARWGAARKAFWCAASPRQRGGRHHRAHWRTKAPADPVSRFHGSDGSAGFPPHRPAPQAPEDPAAVSATRGDAFLCRDFVTPMQAP